MHSLLSISPIDGRYHKQTEHLSEYFSEYGLIKSRLEVEIEYLIALLDLPEISSRPLSEIERHQLRDIYIKCDLEAANRVKQIESITNHDVKAIEYYIKEQIETLGINIHQEWVHFGLTSQDINNTAVPLLLQRFIQRAYIPLLEQIIHELRAKALDWQSVVMIAKTHGQPASPTTMGKEFMVWVTRLQAQLKHLAEAPHTAKFGGATGNLNAHKASFPNVDWIKFSDQFINQLGLQRQSVTTQIEHYDEMAHIFDTSKRIGTILIDMCRDIWSYISFDFFKQKIVAGEIGSSAMPHKVNPIDFENAEGNLMYANAIFEFLSSKLPISRLQRDLTDSTVLRNIGVPYAHSTIALRSIVRGLDKLLLNQEHIALDVDNHWVVISEAIQNILRAEGVDQPYEMLKSLTRQHSRLTQKDFVNFVNELNVSDEVKRKLLEVTPHNYTGYAQDLVK